MKFKVGDKVRVRSLDWYRLEYNREEVKYRFTPKMLELCGKVVTIRQVYYDTEHYIIEEENVFHNWQDYMFEDEVVTENEDVIEDTEVEEPFKIKKGDVFTCIKDVVMNDGVIAYKKGGYYTSELDECITDERHDKEHYWLDKNTFEEYFEYFEYAANVRSKNNDNVNHPKWYTSHPSSIECIEITKHYDFCIGNAIKYLWRAGLKSEQGYSSDEKQIEDLKKAMWYINKKIEMLEK